MTQEPAGDADRDPDDEALGEGCGCPLAAGSYRAKIDAIRMEAHHVSSSSVIGGSDGLLGCKVGQSWTLALKKGTLVLLAMVILVGLGEKMAERFLPLYLVAVGGGAFSIGLATSI